MLVRLVEVLLRLELPQRLERGCLPVAVLLILALLLVLSPVVMKAVVPAELEELATQQVRRLWFQLVEVLLVVLADPARQLLAEVETVS